MLGEIFLPGGKNLRNDGLRIWWVGWEGNKQIFGWLVGELPPPLPVGKTLNVAVC